jgi:hypothetical protein
MPRRSAPRNPPGGEPRRYDPGHGRPVSDSERIRAAEIVLWLVRDAEERGQRTITLPCDGARRFADALLDGI